MTSLSARWRSLWQPSNRAELRCRMSAVVYRELGLSVQYTITITVIIIIVVVMFSKITIQNADSRTTHKS